MSTKARQLGLALGGGGGKGTAHIGVLSALETLQVPIDVVAGTSIGGIVAAMYAMGFTPTQMDAWFQRATARNIFARDPTNGGLIGTHNIEALFREAFGDQTFAETQRPLALVAVDLIAGREVIFRDGPIVDALLATSAIPGLFPPVVRGDAVLVDGGVLNNVPVDVAHSLGAERVIAVELSLLKDDFAYAPPDAAQQRNWTTRQWLPQAPLLLAERALALMLTRMSEQRLTQTPPAVWVRPDAAALPLLDFTRTAEGRAYGEQAVAEHRPQLAALRAWWNGPDHSVEASTVKQEHDRQQSAVAKQGTDG